MFSFDSQRIEEDEGERQRADLDSLKCASTKP